MLHDDKQRSTSNPSLLGMLLESNKIRSKFNDASSSTSTTEEEVDDDILFEPDIRETAEDVLMSSISLDDSSHFVNLDDDEASSSAVPSLTNSARVSSQQSLGSLIIPEETLFDSKEQRYEWNDEFSMLKKLRRTRLSTVVEDDSAPMFQSTTKL
jgi:hypothetical protein